MGEDTRQIEQDIRNTREDLGRNLEELEDRARELADWRSHYRKHPGAFLTVSFGAGFAVGLMAIGRGTRRTHAEEFDFNDSHDPRQPLSQRGAIWSTASQTKARAARQFGDTWEQIADGLFRLASDKAMAFVADLVPGLAEHIGRPAARPVHYPSTSRQA